jgi:hypothetical protein
MLEFGTARPTGHKTLIVEFMLTYRYFDEIREDLRELNKLYAVNYAFTHVPYDQLQFGISRWSLNGVSVEFNQDVVQSVMEMNRKRILEIHKQVERLYTESTAIRAPRRRDLGYFKSTIAFRSDN